MFCERAGMKVDRALAHFLEAQAIPGTGIEVATFWNGVAGLFERFRAENVALLRERERLQTLIDTWHEAQSSKAAEPTAYAAFLRRIGYLVDEPPTFTISPEGVDDEIAIVAGPQLVAPLTNSRFVVNAANARWGSLLAALAETDALGPPALLDRDHRVARGMSRCLAFLDEVAPLALGSHAEVLGYAVEGGQLTPPLRTPAQFVGYRGDPARPSTILLRHNGLHIELDVDGRRGLRDLLLEAALTSICDLEDSVAAVDAQDKVAGYSAWLGLMRGDLTATLRSGDRAVVRGLAPDRLYRSPGGDDLTLPGRSLLLVRNVGHLMTTSAVLLPDGAEAPEGILDAVVTTLIALHDLKDRGGLKNSRSKSVYIVKPKMHGPAEAAFTNRLFDAVEDLLGLARNTIKLGLMDEERRTSVNLAACIYEVKDRIVFINTGFLDRTGDEIHTSLRAGPMIRKAEMRTAPWISAYERRNVQIGLACGFSGRAQIGKGMWTMPDRMAEMLEQKIAHPESGASTAWVPSPTAAVLHALHYHAVDVFERQRELTARDAPSLESLLAIPVARAAAWSAEDIRREIETNAHGILGYVTRWIDHGVGCSKVPDPDGAGLMEDRATLRISSQLIANWLHHGVCTVEDVKAAFRRMAETLDAQCANDAGYCRMSGFEDSSLAFQCAQALALAGSEQPSGYTEPLLHRYRVRRKLSPASAVVPERPHALTSGPT